jgi:predicted dehydrogenase
MSPHDRRRDNIMSERIRTAVIGCGHIGRYHLEKYAASARSELVAVVDADPGRGSEIAAKHGIRALTDHRELFGAVDAVSVAVPTALHHQVASDCLRAGLHVLVEKPMTVTLAEADELIALATKAGRILQVGQLERFNPVTLKLGEVVQDPMFIECHRLAPFNPRGTDVDVVLDLMIHDIDLLLSLVGSPLTGLAASGAPVICNSADIANARLQFANGCVANVTASRISLKSERKMRFFQKDTYISADFQNRHLAIFKREGGTEGVPHIASDQFSVEGDALALQIESFLEAIATGQPPKVTGADGRQALQTALLVGRALASRQPWTEIPHGIH